MEGRKGWHGKEEGVGRVSFGGDGGGGGGVEEETQRVRLKEWKKGKNHHYVAHGHCMRVYQGTVQVEGAGPALAEVGTQWRLRYGVETDFGPTQYA